MLIGMDVHSLDSVIISTSTFNTEQISDSSIRRPNAVIELMLKWTILKLETLKGEPLDKSILTDFGSSSISDIILMSESESLTSLRRSITSLSFKS